MITEGPWTVHVWDKTTTIEGRYTTVAADVTNNDAQLISAAPDMLAALRELFERAEAAGDITGLPEYEQARAAIAKAEGRA